MVERILNKFCYFILYYYLHCLIHDSFREYYARCQRKKDNIAIETVFKLSPISIVYPFYVHV